ncbi:MAG TPA: hypothetical protein VHU15_15050 [Stellaceae bacterium]|nr:hypothetical protein [Stellaceae bacterium]
MPAILSACAQAHTERIDDRTFRIEGPGVPGGSDVPNRRVAEQACPQGYRVIDTSRFKPDAQSPMQTNWTIRCL